MTELEQKIRLSLQNSPRRRHTVLLAVSGGADSVALLRACEKLWREEPGDGRLVVLHANHQLRGAESDADADFVAALCETLGLPCVSRRLNVSVTGNGPEADARLARYAFFEETAEKLGARYLFTAHTRDDQAETVLHHVIRGTGLAGLAGMRKTRPLTPGVTLLRPMLDATREEVLAYLAALGQPFREDSSNAALIFTRNRIRQTLMPLLEADFNPRVENALLRLAELARETVDFLDGETEKLYAAAVRVISSSRTVEIRLDACRDAAPLLKKELLRKIWARHGWSMQEMGKREWDELAEMLCGAPLPARDFPGDVHVRPGKDGVLRVYFGGGI